jgi:hypothetical protein
MLLESKRSKQDIYLGFQRCILQIALQKMKKLGCFKDKWKQYHCNETDFGFIISGLQFANLF